MISKSRLGEDEKQGAECDAYLYRLSDTLGEHVVESAKALDTPSVLIVFDVSNNPTRVHTVEALRGKTGYLTLTRLLIESYEREEYLLFSGIDATGASLDQETMEKLFTCSGQWQASVAIPPAVRERLEADAKQHSKGTVSRSLEQNSIHFNQAREKLEKWAEDMVLSAEKALMDTKEQIKILRRQARQAVTLDEQHEIQQNIQKLEKQQRRQRHDIFTVEDEIGEKRDTLIETLERRLTQHTESEQLFTIEWLVV